MERPRSETGERYVRVVAKVRTWTVVEETVDYDTATGQFVLPSGYQADAKVVGWKYADVK